MKFILNKYRAKYNIFDNIDTEEKAYWLGFLWCDGYVCRRDRKNNGTYTYEIKLSLSEVDIDHLVKFKSFLELENDIKLYNNSKSAFKTKSKEARIMVYNKHMGEILYNKYGIIPNREEIAKTIEYIPKELLRHFIRGIIDAEGSINYYECIDQGRLTKKKALSITTNISILNFINKHLYDMNISCSIINKYNHRHKERDSYCRTLLYSGNIQVPKILKYIYENSNIYLDRKYEKYLIA